VDRRVSLDGELVDVELVDLDSERDLLDLLNLEGCKVLLEDACLMTLSG
jgi:hypothetical protein